MPEGPTIVAHQKQIKKFEGKTVTESGGYRNPFAEDISGKKLLKVDTFGKYLILQFNKFFVTIHFGLYGRYLINDKKKVNPSFTLHFGDDYVNFYVVNLKKIDGNADDYFNRKLDVFSKDFESDEMKQLLLEKLPAKKIGDALMNQEIFPGVGNVIRNEVLFLAKIHPESAVGKIPSKKLDELIHHIREFSISSVELIEKRIWKSSSAVYQKEKFKTEDVKMYVSPAIKRKTFLVESLQKLYS